MERISANMASNHDTLTQKVESDGLHIHESRSQREEVVS
jgi:hypothetical protein